MEVKLLKENEDGSADYSFDLSAEEQDDLIRWAILEALKRAIEESKKYDPSEFSVGDTTSGGKDSVHGSCEQSSEPEQPGNSFKTSQVLG